MAPKRRKRHAQGRLSTASIAAPSPQKTRQKPATSTISPGSPEREVSTLTQDLKAAAESSVFTPIPAQVSQNNGSPSARELDIAAVQMPVTATMSSRYTSGFSPRTTPSTPISAPKVEIVPHHKHFKKPKASQAGVHGNETAKCSPSHAEAKPIDQANRANSASDCIKTLFDPITTTAVQESLASLPLDPENMTGPFDVFCITDDSSWKHLNAFCDRGEDPLVRSFIQDVHRNAGATLHGYHASVSSSVMPNNYPTENQQTLGEAASKHTATASPNATPPSKRKKKANKVDLRGAEAIDDASYQETVDNWLVNKIKAGSLDMETELNFGLQKTGHKYSVNRKAELVQILQATKVKIDEINRWKSLNVGQFPSKPQGIGYRALLNRRRSWTQHNPAHGIFQKKDNMFEDPHDITPLYPIPADYSPVEFMWLSYVRPLFQHANVLWRPEGPPARSQQIDIGDFTTLKRTDGMENENRERRYSEPEEGTAQPLGAIANQGKKRELDVNTELELYHTKGPGCAQSESVSTTACEVPVPGAWTASSDDEPYSPKSEGFSSAPQLAARGGEAKYPNIKGAPDPGGLPLLPEAQKRKPRFTENCSVCGDDDFSTLPRVMHDIKEKSPGTRAEANSMAMQEQQAQITIPSRRKKRRRRKKQTDMFNSPVETGHQEEGKRLAVSKSQQSMSEKAKSPANSHAVPESDTQLKTPLKTQAVVPQQLDLPTKFSIIDPNIEANIEAFGRTHRKRLEKLDAHCTATLKRYQPNKRIEQAHCEGKEWCEAYFIVLDMRCARLTQGLGILLLQTLHTNLEKRWGLFPEAASRVKHLTVWPCRDLCFPHPVSLLEVLNYPEDCQVVNQMPRPKSIWNTSNAEITILVRKQAMSEYKEHHRETSTFINIEMTSEKGAQAPYQRGGIPQSPVPPSTETPQSKLFANNDLTPQVQQVVTDLIRSRLLILTSSAETIRLRATASTTLTQWLRCPNPLARTTGSTHWREIPTMSKYDYHRHEFLAMHQNAKLSALKLLSLPVPGKVMDMVDGLLHWNGEDCVEDVKALERSWDERIELLRKVFWGVQEVMEGFGRRFEGEDAGEGLRKMEGRVGLGDVEEGEWSVQSFGMWGLDMCREELVELFPELEEEIGWIRWTEGVLE